VSWRKAVPRRYLTRSVLGDQRRMMIVRRPLKVAAQIGAVNTAMPDHARTACHWIN